MRAKKNITIYDIAKQTNLSTATISRIINQKGRYSADTEAKVKKAMDELGYSPSASAQSLATQQTHTLGIILPSWNKRSEGDAFTLQFLQGVMAAAHELKYDVLLDNHSSFNPDDAESFMQRKKVDGLIFTYMYNDYHYFLSKLLDNHFPAVYTGRRLSFDKTGCNIYGGHELYKHDFLESCFQKGLQNVAMFVGYFHSENLITAESTMRLMEDFRREKGLSASQYQLILYDYYNTDSFQSQLTALLTKKEPVQAIYLDQLFICTQAYNIIKSLKRRIPEDISIVATSHNQRGGEEFSPKLTTTYVHSYRMGYNSVYKLVDIINSRDSNIQTEIPYSFIYRESFTKE